MSSDTTPDGRTSDPSLSCIVAGSAVDRLASPPPLTPPAGACVGDLKAPTASRDVELVLGRIDPGCRYANLRHLRRPCLVKRTKCSGNHPGPMKALARSRYEAAQKAQGGYDPIASGLPRIAIRGRPFLSEQANDSRSRYYKGGSVTIRCGVTPARPSGSTSTGWSIFCFIGRTSSLSSISRTWRSRAPRKTFCAPK